MRGKLVSGELVIATSRDSRLETLGRAIASLTPLRNHPHAFIGGVAVIARLASAHRVTDDIDAVYEDPAQRTGAVELLISIGAVRDGPGIRLPGGVRLDLIEVGEAREGELPDSVPERMFLLAHAWALRTATIETVALRDPADGSTLVKFEASLASPAALVAMKLQSIPARRAMREHKRAGDAFDLYRLLLAHGAFEVPERLASAPADLGHWCLSQARHLFVDQPEQTIRWFRTYASVPEMDRLTPDDLRAVGDRFVEAIAERL